MTEKLKNTLEQHVLWLRGEGGKKADLSGCNLIRAFSVEIVSDNPSEGLLSKETVLETELENYLSRNVPNCNFDVKRINSDDRCRYFRHYMPTNKTTARHSYKENHQLHKSGNFVKIYISEVFV